jgi:CheY-like chemotaxis protein
MNILIVEDDRTNQMLLGCQAEDVGFDVSVVTADDGEQALQRLVQVAPISLILLDLAMPRMDGFEFLSRLRSRPTDRDIPVIVVTAQDLSEHDHRRLGTLGVTRVFQKGRYDTQALTDAIMEFGP